MPLSIANIIVRIVPPRACDTCGGRCHPALAIRFAIEHQQLMIFFPMLGGALFRFEMVREMLSMECRYPVSGGVTHVAYTIKARKRVERITSWILNGSAWLFTTCCIGLLTLHVSGLAKRWHLDLEQLFFSFFRNVFVPLLMVSSSVNVMLILWRLSVALSTHGSRNGAKRVDGKTFALFFTFVFLAACLVDAGIQLVLRYYPM